MQRFSCPTFPIECRAHIWAEEALWASVGFSERSGHSDTGYHARSRIEAKMKCLKAFGERIASRDPDRQTAEVQIRVALMNRFNALGTAEIERVA